MAAIPNLIRRLLAFLASWARNLSEGPYWIQPSHVTPQCAACRRCFATNNPTRPK